MKQISCFFIKLSLLLLVFIIPNACIDPIIPEFDYKSNVLFIDAYALTKVGQSSVSLKQSFYNNGSYNVFSIDDATVQLINDANNQTINCLFESDGNYFPPADFAVNYGESWFLSIKLSDGRTYRSKSETINKPIPIDNIKATYNEELYFDEGFLRFVPGHAISIDWKDPIEKDNYYLWKYRSYEPLTVCQTCTTGPYRNGACTQEFRWRNYVDYLCQTDCWQVRYSDKFQITTDQLFNGKTVTDRRIANIPYFRGVDILVEVQQISLTESAYEYFKIIDDISNQSGGLNAPPPAALTGNIYSESNPNEVVLGQFTASGIAVETVYIHRSDLGSEPLTPDDPVKLENCGVPCPDSLIYFPCLEDNFRTAVRPEGWQ